MDPSDPIYSSLPGWLELLHGIDDEISALHLRRDTWRGLVKIVQSNPAIPPSHFFQFLTDTYGATQAVAIRRLADKWTGERVISFVALLSDLKANAGLVTREWWLSDVKGGETLGSRLTPRGALSPEGLAAWQQLTQLVRAL